MARTRIKSLNPLVTTARRTNNDDVSRPSLLAPSHQPTTNASRGALPPQNAPARPPGITHVVMEGKCWSGYDAYDNCQSSFGAYCQQGGGSGMVESRGE